VPWRLAAASRGRAVAISERAGHVKQFLTRHHAGPLENRQLAGRGIMIPHRRGASAPSDPAPPPCPAVAAMRCIMAATDSLRGADSMQREHQRYVWLALALALAPLGGARAATYEFLAAPQTDLNRVFRLDKVTGEVGA